jgi:hypothetical protein
MKVDLFILARYGREIFRSLINLGLSVFFCTFFRNGKMIISSYDIYNKPLPS